MKIWEKVSFANHKFPEGFSERYFRKVMRDMLDSKGLKKKMFGEKASLNDTSNNVFAEEK